MAKDGAHYPSQKYKENFNSIFKNKKRLSPKTTKQFLEGMENEKSKHRS
tara:strand:- start:147 stop:293 length:147 start_codon:yes stop_codon:yes gene_type:complete